MVIKMKILVLAPHPDDEVLGCGGTIAKHVQQGDEVHLCIVTKAYAPDWSEEFLKNRPREIKNASKILGIKRVYFLDFPAVKLDTVPQKELNEAISRVVERVRPYAAYIPHKGDINKDHRLVFEAALVALRPKPKISAKKVLAYETLSETEWGIPEPKEVFLPNFYVDISDTLRIKLKAMMAYKSELKSYPHPRSLKGIRALAIKRGSEVGLKAAEAFMLVREILV
jgi:LmbE family N-acetylglucosaminyl deacetylase